MNQRVRAGNRVYLLRSGKEFFPTLIRAIEEARTEVLLETYIFANDATADAVADALCEAAQRGVCVRIMVDGFGARDFVKHRMQALIDQGVEVLVFRREVNLFSTERQRLRRLHRKLIAIDGCIGFVGGINIIDDLDTPGQIPPRFDYAVRIEGPVVVDIQHTMIRLWRMISWANFRKHTLPIHWTRPDRRAKGSVVASLLVRDNVRHRTDIENAYLDMLNSATEEVIIANAYFLPGRRFRHALISAVRRGVRVTLLLQGKVEYWLLHHATRALYPHLLRNGIRIFEYKRGFLHAKVASADGWWATVGSSNIDPFSLLLAREANIVIHDERFAEQLNNSLHKAIEHGATELKEQDWRQPPRLQRLISWFALGLIRLMLGLIGLKKLH